MATHLASTAEKPPFQEALRQAERLARHGKVPEAESAFRSLLADLRLLPRMPFDAYGRARNGLGRLLVRQRRDAEAAETFRKNIAVLGELLDTSDDSSRADVRSWIELARSLVSLSGVCHRAGEAAEADALLNRAVCEVLRRAMSAWEERGSRSESLAAALSDMAIELRAQGRAESAERMLRMELAERERLESAVRVTSRTRIQLAQCLLQQKKHQEAERMFRSALEQRVNAGLPVDAITKARCWLATCLLAEKRPEEAEQVLLDGLSELRDLDDQPKSRAALRYTLARVNLEQGRDGEAKEMLQKGLEDLESVGDDPDAAALHRVGLAKILHAEGQRMEAEATLLQAFGDGRKSELHPQTREMIRQHLRAFRAGQSNPGSSLSGSAGRTTLHGLEAGG